MSLERAIAITLLVALNSCSREPPARERGTRPVRDPVADSLQRQGRGLLDARRAAEAERVLRDAYDRHVGVLDHGAASVDARLLVQVSRRQSDYREALRWGDKARAEAIASADDALLGHALIVLAGVLHAVGDEAGRDEMVDQAARHLPDGDRAGRAHVRIYRGLRLRADGHRALAVQEQEEALALARDAGDQHLVLSASVNLADLAMADHRPDDAERHLREAREAWRAQGKRNTPHAILINESILARQRKDLVSAAAALDQAVDPPPDTAWHIHRQHGLIAEAAGRLDEAEAKYQEAIEVIEALRARSVARAESAPFFEERWGPFGDLFALQIARGDARGAFATLAQAQGRRFLEALAMSVAARTPDRSGSRVQDAIGRLDRLDALFPSLARSPLGALPQAGDLLSNLRGKYVLSYFAGGGRLRMLAVVDGKPRISSVDVELEELDRLIDAFRRRPDDAEAAAALGSALVPPDVIARAPARIHVVPTGPLLSVAFAALRPSGRRLLDRHEVAYAPSVTALAVTGAERVEGGGASVVTVNTRSNLAEARDELLAVVAATGAIPYLGPGALDAALRRASGAPLLHVISHSAMDRRGGYLLDGDRQVTAAKILALGIRPRLVVLPTCASAATVRAEMWDSLAAAFLAAGSRDVVATLASVQDPVAARFTLLFYAHGGVDDPVGAVTRAQREMAVDRPVADWSSFVAIGL